MATLEQNIERTIEAFDDIAEAISEKGVPVADGTDVEEYGNLIRRISSSGSATEWDCIITDADALMDLLDNPQNYAGAVLVKGVSALVYGGTYTLQYVTYLKFVNSTISLDSMAVELVGNKNCTIDGLYYEPSGEGLHLQNFGKVVNCRHNKDGDSAFFLQLADCDYVHNCDFTHASRCNHISDCALTVYSSGVEGIVLEQCTHIHGLKIDNFDETYYGQCIFHECLYMSNINIGGGDTSNLVVVYHNCRYVDADTCSGFLSDEDVGKVQVLTADGSFATTDSTDGEDGEDGEDGVSVTHSWNGTVLTVTSASGTSSANLKGDKGDKGDPYILTAADKTEIAENVKSDCIAKNQGAANVGKILVVGTDGNLTLADMPEGGASGDVIGTLDDSNNILLSGNLADGTYTLKYENTDGTYTEIGNLVVGDIVVEPTNLFVVGGDGYILNGRCSSTGANRTDSNGYIVSNYIKVKNGDTLYIKNASVSDGSSAYSGIKLTDGTTVGVFPSSSSDVANYAVSNGITQFTINRADADYIRVCFAISSGTALSDSDVSSKGIIITVNEPLS